MYRYPARSGDNDTQRIGYWFEPLGGTPVGTGVWHCPSATFPLDHPAGSYGYNAWGLYSRQWSNFGLGGHTAPIPGGGPHHAPPIGESEVIAPGDMMAIADTLNGGDLFWRGALIALRGEEIGRATSRH